MWLFSRAIITTLKNLNRIKNRKEKRLKGEKKKEDIFPIGRINIGAIEKKKKFEPSSI